MSGRAVLLGIVWRDNVAHVRLRNEQAPASVLSPVAGHRLAYRVGAAPGDTGDSGDYERVCLGHVPFRAGQGDYHDCSELPEPRTRTCRRCAAVEATFAANLHHAHTRGSAELDPAIAEHLRQPNRLYLAAFRDGSIKIGTTTVARAERRLTEQGAWLARFVAETTDGREVRLLEDEVTDRLGLAQAVSAGRKLAGLVSPVADEQLAAMLSARAEEVFAAVVEPAAGVRVTPIDERWRHPATDLVIAATPIAYPLTLTKGRHELDLMGAIGRHLVASRHDDTFVFDPAPLYGRWIEPGEFGSDEIAVQGALF